MELTSSEYSPFVGFYYYGTEPRSALPKAIGKLHNHQITMEEMNVEVKVKVKQPLYRPA